MLQFVLLNLQTANLKVITINRSIVRRGRSGYVVVSAPKFELELLESPNYEFLGEL